MKKLLLISSLFATATAVAKPINYQKGDVFWLSGAIGQTSVDSTKGSTDLLSFKFNTGYDVNEYFGFYAGAGTLRDLDERNINYLETGISAFIPMSDEWTFRTSFGGTSTTNGDVSGKIEPKIGVGFAYEITPQFTTQITYDHFFDLAIEPNLKEDAQQLSWGFTYYFGRPKSAATTIQQIKIYQ